MAGKGVVALGVAMGAVGLGAVKMANTFNTQMLKIRTEGGATSKEFKHMKSAVLDLAASGKSMGASPTSLAMGLYHLESMGLRGKQALLGLKLASQEAAISGANLEDTTTAIGGAMFVAMKGTGNMAHMMGTLNAIAGAGNMRFQDLNEALGHGLLSSAKLAGLSLQETGAALAILTDSGQHAASAGAQLATAFHFMTTPTGKATTALKNIGITQFQLAHDMKGPNGLHTALKDLRDHLSGVGADAKASTLNALFPGGRGRVLLQLYGMQDRFPGKTAQTSSGSAQQYNTHVMEQAKNASTRLAMAHARLQAGMVRLGNVLTKNLTPALISLENAGSAVLGWVIKALPGVIRLTRDGFQRMVRVGKDVVGVILGIANSGFVAWVVKAAGVVGSWVNTGLKAFSQGWRDLMAAIQPVITGLQTVVGLIPQISLPNLPGAGPTVTAAGGTAAQRRAATQQLQKKAGFLGVHAPAGNSSGGHRVAGAPNVGTHAVYNGPDLNIHIGGHHFAKVTRREIQKAMMAGA
jgi:TP901 family phage tail tape measure protein